VSPGAVAATTPNAYAWGEPVSSWTELKLTRMGPPVVTKKLEVVVKVNDRVDNCCVEFTAAAALRLSVARTAAKIMQLTTSDLTRI